jgi:hypothetical protein
MPNGWQNLRARISFAMRRTLEPAAKPDSVPFPKEGGSHLSGAHVTAHLDAAYPELGGNGPLPVPKGTCPCLALLLVGFAWPRRSPASPVVSYTTISPLPRGAREAVSFLWHSAVRSPRLAVSQHHALWSPDFPRSTQDTVPRGTQLPGQLERSPIVARVAAEIKLRKTQDM